MQNEASPQNSQPNSRQQAKDTRIHVDPTLALMQQTIIFYEYYWIILQYTISFLVLTFKGNYFFYPPNTLAPEAVCLLIALATSYTRVYIGNYANKTENGMNQIWFVVQSIPLIMTDLFFITTQTYVLHLDVIIFSMAIFWHSLGFLFSIILTIKYFSYY